MEEKKVGGFFAANVFFFFFFFFLAHFLVFCSSLFVVFHKLIVVGCNRDTAGCSAVDVVLFIKLLFAVDFDAVVPNDDNDEDDSSNC